jgi:alanine racemase
MRPAPSRPAWVEVDLDAIGSNVELLADLAAPAGLCVVVKANAYGHGAVQVARTVVAAGAAWLAVAVLEEGAELRRNGLDVPILLLSQPPLETVGEVLAWSLTPTLESAVAVDAFDAHATASTSVHLKVDTGMHRVGAPPEALVPLARRVAASRHLTLGGVWTHLACADEPHHPANRIQLDRYATVCAELAEAGIDPGVRHVANSAATLAFPEARFDLVRSGIAVYGIAPSAGVDHPGLRPALSLKARVTHLTDLAAGEGVSYGHRFVAERPTRIATVPLGYADGVWRNAGLTGVEVLIGGRRHPIVGVVTMDQLMVEVGDEPVEPGDEVVIIGRQGSESVTATEIADRAGTIPYEVLTRLSDRLPRRFSPAEAAEAPAGS